MPKKVKSATAIDADTLRQYKAKGVQSAVLDARLAYTDAEGFARYARSMAEVDRVHPNMLPTQAGARWSTTGPPLVNFPPSLEDCIIPDPGTYWIAGDMDAVEARIAAGYAGDKDDLDAFNNGWDVHTITACRMFGKPLPPILTKALHSDPSCAEWWKLWEPEWGWDDNKRVVAADRSKDRRRHLAKTMRYATQYGPNEYAALNAKDIEKLGLSRQELLGVAKRYLQSKPALVAAKLKAFAECARTHTARTFIGRRRRLFGNEQERGKMGWNSMIQPAVSDMMNLGLIEIDRRLPESWLILNAHDGFKQAFPNDVPLRLALEVCSQAMEKTWDINGHKVKITCEWKVWLADGRIVDAGKLLQEVEG